MKRWLMGARASCLLILLFFCSWSVISAPQGQGRVNMQGAIIDTACAIATESREQIIEMDVTPLSDIARDGEGKRVPFSIELVNCILERPNKAMPDWRQFQVTFDGQADGDMFGISGDISGVALKIIDSAGNTARPGVPLPLVEMLPGNYRLNYTMTVTSNQRQMKAGSYSSSVRFKMDYY